MYITILNESHTVCGVVLKGLALTCDRVSHFAHYQNADLTFSKHCDFCLNQYAINLSYTEYYIITFVSISDLHWILLHSASAIFNAPFLMYSTLPVLVTSNKLYGQHIYCVYTRVRSSRFSSDLVPFIFLESQL